MNVVRPHVSVCGCCCRLCWLFCPRALFGLNSCLLPWRPDSRPPSPSGLCRLFAGSPPWACLPCFRWIALGALFGLCPSWRPGSLGSLSPSPRAQAVRRFAPWACLPCFRRIALRAPFSLCTTKSAAPWMNRRREEGMTVDPASSRRRGCLWLLSVPAFYHNLYRLTRRFFYVP